MTRKPERWLLAVLLAVVPLVVAPAAHAGRPGIWEALHGGHPTTVFQPSLARDGAGDLHAAYVVQRAGDALDLLERRIRPSGAVAAPRTVLSGFTTLGDPALLADRDGLRILVGAQRTTDTEDPVVGILTSTAAAAGGTWSPAEVTTSPEGEAGLRSGDVSALVTPAGVPVALSSGTGFGVVAHVGLDPLLPAVSLQDQFTGCCIGQAALVRDERSGAVVAVYQSVIAGNDGVFTQAVDAATGAPASPPVPLPGLGAAGGADLSDPVLARTAAAARVGGGVYVAVPSGLAQPDRTRLWRAGGGAARTLGRGGGRHYAAAVVATPDSRLWVAWSEERADGTRVVLRRSNPSVTRFGEEIELEGPDAGRVYDLDGSSQALRLDLVATSGTAESRPYHTQVLPPLELRASPRRFRGGRAARVRFRVTDVGVPVVGATVRAGGRQTTTNRRGRAVLILRGPAGGGRMTADARKTDYARDSVTLTVRRERRRG